MQAGADRFEEHKSRLRQYYLVDGLSVKMVKQKMISNWNFHANANGYTRHFKQWGFRKNLSAKQWNTIARIIEKRKREDGKESEVWVDGVKLPESKVRRAISATRHGHIATFERLKEENGSEINVDDDMLSGILISTPSSEATSEEHQIQH